MFKGDCLSLNINNSNAFLSRYVMLCHAFRHVITDKWPGRTKHQKKNDIDILREKHSKTLLGIPHRIGKKSST